MTNIIKDTVLRDNIVEAFCGITERCEFPKFGSSEISCDKCMFREITCYPDSDCVGCFIGWKTESDA